MIKLKSGQELSELTRGVRARLAIRDHFECPEPVWVRRGVMPLFYLLVTGVFFYFLWEGF